MMSQKGSRHTQLQERLKYQFRDHSKLTEALLHSSLSGEMDNQRYEFLGDRVLGLVISEALLDHFPKAREGELAPKFNHLVRKETCAEVAEALHLGDEIKLGRSEAMSGGRRKVALLGDLIEAVIAAIYLDGGFPAARDFILRHWAKKIEHIPENTVDPKTRLQEFMQSKGEATPKYDLVERSGPDHAPIFTVSVIAGGLRAEGSGNTKRRAEVEAAERLLVQLLDETT